MKAYLIPELRARVVPAIVRFENDVRMVEPDPSAVAAYLVDVDGIPAGYVERVRVEGRAGWRAYVDGEPLPSPYASRRKAIGAVVRGFV